MINYIKNLFKSNQKIYNFLDLKIGKQYSLDFTTSGISSTFYKDFNPLDIKTTLTCIENTFLEEKINFVDYIFQLQDQQDLVLRLEYDDNLITRMYALLHIDTFIQNAEFSELYNNSLQLVINDYTHDDDILLDVEYDFVSKQEKCSTYMYYKNSNKKNTYDQKKYIDYKTMSELVIQKRKDEFVYKIYECLFLNQFKLM